MTRTLIIEFDDPEALKVIRSICEAIAETETCCHPESGQAVGSTGKPQSRKPKGDVDALRVLAADVKSLQGTLRAIDNRLGYLVSRQTSRTSDGPDSIGGIETDLVDATVRVDRRVHEYKGITMPRTEVEAAIAHRNAITRSRG